MYLRKKQTILDKIRETLGLSGIYTMGVAFWMVPSEVEQACYWKRKKVCSITDLDGFTKDIKDIVESNFVKNTILTTMCENNDFNLSINARGLIAASYKNDNSVIGYNSKVDTIGITRGQSIITTDYIYNLFNMKFIELKENEPLEVIKVTNSQVFHNFSNDKSNMEYNAVENKRIQMKIFTDEEIEKQTEEILKNIDEYYIGGKKYQYDVDTLKTKNMYFKNHSYVITYLIAEELMTKGNIFGWFYVIKDVSIYLKNTKDKKALRCAKQVIKEISNHNNSIDYISIFSMILSKENEQPQKFEKEKISKNVYSFKKIDKIKNKG